MINNIVSLVRMSLILKFFSKRLAWDLIVWRRKTVFLKDCLTRIVTKGSFSEITMMVFLVKL